MMSFHDQVARLAAASLFHSLFPLERSPFFLLDIGFWGVTLALMAGR